MIGLGIRSIEVVQWLVYVEHSTAAAGLTRLEKGENREADAAVRRFSMPGAAANQPLDLQSTDGLLSTPKVCLSTSHSSWRVLTRTRTGGDG